MTAPATHAPNIWLTLSQLAAELVASALLGRLAAAARGPKPPLVLRPPYHHAALAFLLLFVSGDLWLYDQRFPSGGRGGGPLLVVLLALGGAYLLLRFSREQIVIADDEVARRRLHWLGYDRALWSEVIGAIGGDGGQVYLRLRNRARLPVGASDFEGYPELMAAFARRRIPEVNRDGDVVAKIAGRR